MFTVSDVVQAVFELRKLVLGLSENLEDVLALLDRRTVRHEGDVGVDHQSQADDQTNEAAKKSHCLIGKRKQKLMINL